MPLEAISKLGFFKRLSDEALDEIVSAARPLTLRKGEFLLMQDEPAERFFLLRSGRVRLTQVTADGHQVVVRFVSPGEGIGIVAVLGKIRYPVSADGCYESNKRVLRQEETTDGRQQALGRHLGRLAGAERNRRGFQ